MYVRWKRDGWHGWIDPALDLDPTACFARVRDGADRASRHASTVRVGSLFVKLYPAPGGWRAMRAFRQGRALAAAGFAAPETGLVARCGAAGLLVTRDVGGEE